MKLTNINQLYNEMKENKQPRQQFQIEYNHVLADVFFFIDQTPFVLAFGIVATQAYFELQVSTGFQVIPVFDKEIYDLIIREFHIRYDPNHKFRPLDFLEAINRKLPQHVSATKSVEPRHIAKYHRDIDEAEKIYFCGFISQRKFGRNVSQKNLNKTRTLMGEAAYQRCLKEKISTKWTDEKGADRYRQWKEIAPSDYLDS